ISGQMPILDDNKSDFFFIKHTNKLKALEDIKNIYINRLPKAYGFSTLWDIQILCPSRKGELGTYTLNTEIRNELNPKSADKIEITHNGVTFRENDKVMQTKNNYDIEYEKNGQILSGIYNGDIGVIIKINKLAGVTTIDFEGKIVEYEKDSLSQLEFSYAITVHKSQGNEFEAVILPILETNSLLYYRNLLYTAVTRAKKVLILIGREDSIIYMVKNDKKNLRYTGLKKFLTDEIIGY
ncbi:MAG: ATP-dependent DNA helicase, partial [Oscillospiraceae bacterium]